MNYNDVYNVTTETLLDVRLVIKQKCHIGKMCEIESRGWELQICSAILPKINL